MWLILIKVHMNIKEEFIFFASDSTKVNESYES